eukprot:5283526-Pyramimonas_sp.AAC.1
MAASPKDPVSGRWGCKEWAGGLNSSVVKGLVKGLTSESTPTEVSVLKNVAKIDSSAVQLHLPVVLPPVLAALTDRNPN